MTVNRFESHQTSRLLWCQPVDEQCDGLAGVLIIISGTNQEALPVLANRVVISWRCACRQPGFEQRMRHVCVPVVTNEHWNGR